MKISPTIQKTFQDKWPNILLPILIALIFFAFTFAYYPFREKIQLNPDEGMNVMSSMLLVRGHSLYVEVFSDHPPLFVHLLGLLFRVSGLELNAGRLLVLLFSTLLVWASAQFLQNTWGKTAALLFLPVIIITPQYLLLSVAVMIGVPSIALAVISMLSIALWHQNPQRLWLILSSIALALSILIKLFTGFLAPIFVIGITISAYLRAKQTVFSWGLFQPAIIWGTCFTGIVMLVGLTLIGPQNIPQIILPHLNATQQTVYQSQDFTINSILLQKNIPLLLLGGAGILLVIYKRNWLFLYPLAWLVAAYLFLSSYTPVWNHHQLLVTIPASIFAAVAAAEGVSLLIRFKQIRDTTYFHNILRVIALICFVWVSVKAFPVLDKELMDSPRISGFVFTDKPAKMRVFHTMEQYADKTNWVVTDLPIYAFLIRRPVPPILANFSEKRLLTGNITNEIILATMREYKPEQVLMGRFDIPALEEYLKTYYTLISKGDNLRLFLRNDLVP